MTLFVTYSGLNLSSMWPSLIIIFHFQMSARYGNIWPVTNFPANPAGHCDIGLVETVCRCHQGEIVSDYFKNCTTCITIIIFTSLAVAARASLSVVIQTHDVIQLSH